MVAATNAVLTDHGAGERPAPELIAGMVDPTGMRMGKLLDVADQAEQKRLAEAFYEAAHRLYRNQTTIYAGVAEALAELAASGVSQGVVSNNQGRLVRRLLDHFGLTRYLTVALGEEDVPAPKPDPRGVQLAAQRLGVTPSACVYVGDAPGDQHTARAAGMPAIGVAWGISPRPVLEREDFATVIDHPRALTAALARLA